MATIKRVVRDNPLSQFQTITPPASGGYAFLASTAQQAYQAIRPAAQAESEQAGYEAVSKAPDGTLSVHLRNPLGGEFAQIHNAAAKAAYGLEIENKSREDFSAMAEQVNYDPDAFATQGQAYVNRIIQDAPAELRGTLRMSMSRAVSRQHLGLVEQKREQTRKRMENALSANIEGLTQDYIAQIAAGDTEGARATQTELATKYAMREAAPGSTWTEEQTKLALDQAGDKATEARVQSMIAGGSLEAARAALDSGTLPPGIEAQLRNRIRQEGRARAAEARRVQREAMEAEASALVGQLGTVFADTPGDAYTAASAIEDDELRSMVINGLNGRSAERQSVSAKVADDLRLEMVTTGRIPDIEEIEANDSLTAADKTSLIQTALNATSEQREIARNVANFEQGAVYRPENDEDVEAADSVYVEMTGGESILSSPAARAVAVEMAGRGVLPPTAMQQIKSGLNSSDPALMEAALQIAQGIQTVNPVAFSGDKFIRESIIDFQANVSLGDSPDVAVARIIEQNDPVLQQQRTINDSANDKIIQSVTPGSVENLFDTLTSRQPDLGATPEMAGIALAEYRAMLRQELDRGAPENTARARADARFKSLYGVSEVSGSRSVMKYPPENMYPALGGGHGYIREQLEREVAEVFGGDAPAGEIILTSVPQTQRDVEAGRPPRYQVQMLVERDGVTFVEIPDLPLWSADPSAARDAVREELELGFRDARETATDRQRRIADFQANNSAARPRQ